MSIKRRIRKLETVQAKANGGLVIITCGPDDDAKELQCERFGLDGPPPDATVLLVNTGVPQAKPLIAKSGHWKGRPVRQNSASSWSI